MISEKDLKEINPENLKFFLISKEEPNWVPSKFKEFFDNLKRYFPLNLENKEEKVPDYPALKVTDKEEKTQIYYMAIPEGLERQPFLNALKAISKRESFLNKDEVERIKIIKNLVEIKIFITPFCPFCPSVVDKANQIAIAQNLIKVFIIDATLFPELSQKYKVTASPTVVINEDFVLVGNEAKEGLLNFIEKAGETLYDKEVLKNLLKQAQAERVIELCEKDEKCLHTLIELLKAPELFTRIGVMYVLEEMAERGKIKNKAKILSHLIETLKTVKDERDKGDILYLLGLIGTPDIVSKIEEAIKDEPPLIKEIAYEAIERIKQRETFH